MRTFKEKHLKEIINYQMELNGYKERFEDLEKIKDWFIIFTTTEKKEKEFKNYLREHLKPFVNKSRIDKEVGRFLLCYGLKTVND